MSKAYIVTAVNYGDSVDGKARTIGASFDRDEAQRVLNADMDYYKAMNPTYKEGELAVTDDDGNGCEWNIESMDIRIPLTPMQVSNLNLLALNIAGNPKSFADYENLSDEERAYLVDTLKKTYHIDINKEGK